MRLFGIVCVVIIFVSGCALLRPASDDHSASRSDAAVMTAVAAEDHTEGASVEKTSGHKDILRETGDVLLMGSMIILGPVTMGPGLYVWWVTNGCPL